MKTTNKSISIINIVATIILIILSVYILIIGRSLLLPFITAILLWYIIIRFAAFIQEPIPKIRYSWRLPYPVALFLSILFTACLIYWFFFLLTESINNVVADASKYQQFLQQVIEKINNRMGQELKISDLVNQINLQSIFSNVAVLLSDLATNFALILVYLLFIFLEYNTFDVKLKAICRSEKRYDMLVSTLAVINNDVSKYLKIKAVLSFLTGFFSYVILKIFHIQYAEFWGLLIFVLNFIPTVGAIIAVSITLLAAAIQVTSVFMFLFLAIPFLTLQLIMGNLVEPKFMGTHLNLSPMVILLGLAFWGKVWGIVGMLLCVPLMSITNIVLANFPQTRSIAILLSAKGKL